MEGTIPWLIEISQRSRRPWLAFIPNEESTSLVSIAIQRPITHPHIRTTTISILNSQFAIPLSSAFSNSKLSFLLSLSHFLFLSFFISRTCIALLLLRLLLHTIPTYYYILQSLHQHHTQDKTRQAHNRTIKTTSEPKKKIKKKPTYLPTYHPTNTTLLFLTIVIVHFGCHFLSHIFLSFLASFIISCFHLLLPFALLDCSPFKNFLCCCQSFNL